MALFRLVVLALVLAAAPLRADDVSVDVVMLVDVSGEMDRKGHFPRARQLLLDLVDRAAQPGAQIAIIPFGDGVHEPQIVRVPHGKREAAGARARLRRGLEALRAHDPHRYLHAALERGVRQLRAFARHRPNHERRLVVVSTGSRHVAADANASALADRLVAAGDRVIAPGSGWTLWYGHFQDGDPDVLDFLAQRGAGTALSLDNVEPMRWTACRIETPYVAVGELPEGEWKRRVRIFVSGVPGTELAMRTHAGKSKVGATLTAMPLRTTLKRGRSTVAVTLSGFRPAGARYSGAHLRVDGVGPWPVWVTGSRIALDAGPDTARATLDATELRFERVDRGTQMGKILRIVPNDSAKRRRSQIGFEVREVPADVDVTVDPPMVRLDRDQDVTIRVAPRPGSTPGTYESRIVLEPRDGLRLQNKEIRIRYKIGHGSIRIENAALAFGKVSRGTDKIVQLSLVPDLGAVESGARVKVSAEGVPTGVDLEFQEKFTLFGKSALEVRARVSSFREDGPIEALLRFEATGNVRMIPETVPITIEVVPPPSVKLGDTVEIGRVRQSQLDGYVFSFPVDIDPAHHGTVVELVPQTPGTRLDPPQVRLSEGRQWLRFKLVSSQRDEGAQSAQFAVFAVRDGSRRSEGHIRLVWTVEESYVRFIEWQDPAPLASEANVVIGRMMLDASPDLRGRSIELRTRFPQGESKARIAAVLEAVELLGGSQTVPVPIDVVSAAPGEYDGVIELSMSDPSGIRVTVKPIPIKVVVPQPPPVIALLSPEKRTKLIAVGSMIAGLLLCLLWLLRKNRRSVRRMVRFTPPPTPISRGELVDQADQFVFEDDLG
ncbi:MAG: vWA domain-containing protein [Planctomycetota bacterium]|jgi:hypothetical protein